MATLLDISLLGHFSDVFVILFVFTTVYAILLFKNPFGGNKGLNALLAFGISMIMAFQPKMLGIISDTVPWAVVMMVIIMSVFLATRSIGLDLPTGLTKNLGTWLLVSLLVIFVINISMKFGDTAGPYVGGGVNGTIIDPDNVIANGQGDVATDSFAANFGATLFHPKVLAMLLILIIGLFSVLLVGYWT